MASSISDLGNGLGYLYVTDKTGIIDGIIDTINNDSEGARKLLDYGSKSFNVALGTKASAYVDIDSITGLGSDELTFLQINTVDQVAAPVVAPSTDTEEFAGLVADAINNHTPASGVDYSAQAEGSRVWIFPPDGTGSDVNGHALNISTVDITTSDSGTVTGGDDGSGLVNEKYGLRFFMNADYDSAGCAGCGSASTTSLSNSIEITDYVVNQGYQTAPNTQSIVMDTTAKKATISRKRNLQFISLTTGGGASDLNSINTNGFAINDMIFVYGGNPAQVITLKDYDGLGGAAGNIHLQSDDDFATGSFDYIIGLRLVDDATYGRIWVEFFRSPSNIADGSITNAKIAPGAVDTAEIAASAITTALINAGAVGSSEIDTDAVTTDKIIDNAVTTAKILNDAVTTDKILNDNVTTDKVADLAITNAKLAAAAVSVDKVSTSLKTVIFHAELSFETNETGDIKVYIPWDITIDRFDYAVTKEIESTDDASVETLNVAASMATTTITKGSSIGTVFVENTLANNTFTAGTYLTFRTSKSTNGGKVNVTITGTLQ